MAKPLSVKRKGFLARFARSLREVADTFESVTTDENESAAFRALESALQKAHDEEEID